MRKFEKISFDQFKKDIEEASRQLREEYMENQVTSKNYLMDVISKEELDKLSDNNN